MIPEIDFLPTSYKLTRERRKRKQWRLVAMIVALVLIGAGSIRQRQISGSLADMRDRMRSNLNRLTAQVNGAPRLTDELNRLDSQVNVVTFLRSKLPPSRVLLVVSNALPEHVTLTQCRASVESLPKKSGATTGRREKSASPTDPKPADKLPAQKDLDTLLKRTEESAQFVSLSGIAPDDGAIAHYLGTLQNSGLFSDVTLEFTDLHTVSDQSVRKFGVKLRVNKVEPWRVRKPDSRGTESAVSNAANSPVPDTTPTVNRRSI
jgi:Tfp pilus assembly protein PilN